MSVVPGTDPRPIRILRKTLIIFVIGMAGSGVLATLLARAVFAARNAAKAATVL